MNFSKKSYPRITRYLHRASELMYGIIPELQKQVPTDKEMPQTTLLHSAVTEKDIALVVSRATGIPLSNLLVGDRERILDMEKALSSR